MKMKKQITILSLSLALSASALAWADSVNSYSIVLLSKGKGGSTEEMTLSSELYSRQVTGLFNNMNRTIQSSVKEHKDGHSWKLNAIMVGVALKIEGGLGPVLEMGVKPRFRLVYLPKGSTFFPNLD